MSIFSGFSFKCHIWSGKDAVEICRDTYCTHIYARCYVFYFPFSAENKIRFFFFFFIFLHEQSLVNSCKQTHILQSYGKNPFLSILLRKIRDLCQAKTVVNDIGSCQIQYMQRLVWHTIKTAMVRSGQVSVACVSTHTYTYTGLRRRLHSMSRSRIGKDIE